MSAKNYKEQYDRMIRWYNRLDEAHKFYNTDMNANENYYDDVIYAFFQNCYHLRDWIAHDPNFLICESVEKKRYEYINKHLIECNDCMKICADICIGSKHCIIDRERIDRDTKLEGKVYNIDINSTFGGKEDLVETRVDRQVRLINMAKSYKVMTLSKECIERWNVFIKDHMGGCFK